MAIGRVAIVVLNWNGIDDTILCLNSLQKQSFKDFQIIVVDNASTDESKKVLEQYEKKHNNTTVIYNSKNYGFAGGVNTGIEFALNDDFDYVALINNDAVADSNWLECLVESAKPAEIGICTGLLLHDDGKTIDSTGDWYSKWGLPFPRSRNEKVDTAPGSGFVFGASGGSSLYKVKMLRQIGMFDEDFFAYYEDVDISFRAQLAGWKVYYNPKAIAYHKRGTASNKLSGFAALQTFKNLPLLYIKNVPRGSLFNVGIRFYPAYLLMLANAIKKGNGKSAVRGALKGFTLGFVKMGERSSIQKNKRVSNSYIKSLLWPDMPPDQTGLRKFRKIFTGKK